ncbi:MAG: hypothetical protein EOO07_15650 [Chitinophagaceae bacterium]|nr:MAG: hypothetical protein EOO07_15650 [Chitinophagaceae bacterium]
MLTFCTTVHAQVRGIVFDHASRKPLAQVEITNITTPQKTNGNDKGEFTINAKLNEVLVFSRPGYRPDTVLLTQLRPVQRYLVLDRNNLSTVTISGKKKLKDEYALAFNKANPILLVPGRGLLFYPSGYFSREGKQARRFVRMLKRDEKEKEIDRRFNLKSISLLIPIKQPELDAFYVRYKPTLRFARKVSEDDLKSYVLDCYNKFKLIPPAQRNLPPLRSK